MSFTFLSAAYANPDNTSVVATTLEVGAVAISVTDNPEEWEDLATSGVVVTPYAAPVPSTVSAFQAKAALMNAGLFVQSENAAAAVGGLTLLAWQEATEFQRQSPAIAALSAAIGLSDNQVDALFTAASKITA